MTNTDRVSIPFSSNVQTANVMHLRPGESATFFTRPQIAGMMRVHGLGAEGLRLERLFKVGASDERAIAAWTSEKQIRAGIGEEIGVTVHNATSERLLWAEPVFVVSHDGAGEHLCATSRPIAESQTEPLIVVPGYSRETYVIRIARAFQPERLILLADRPELFRVFDLRFGKHSQIACSDPINGGHLTRATSPRMRFERLHVGWDVGLELESVSPRVEIVGAELEGRYLDVQ